MRVKSNMLSQSRKAAPGLGEEGKEKDEEALLVAAAAASSASGGADCLSEQPDKAPPLTNHGARPKTALPPPPMLLPPTATAAASNDGVLLPPPHLAAALSSASVATTERVGRIAFDRTRVLYQSALSTVFLGTYGNVTAAAAIKMTRCPLGGAGAAEGVAKEEDIMLQLSVRATSSWFCSAPFHAFSPLLLIRPIYYINIYIHTPVYLGICARGGL